MLKVRLFLIAFLFVLFPVAAFAQPHAGQVGIAAGLQDLQLDFTVPVWAAEQVVLAPSVGFLHSSDKGSEFDLALALRIYFSRQKLSPYAGLRGGALMLKPTNKSTVTDKIFGIFFGGEYFFDQQLSVGAELQLNMAVSDESSNRFGSPGGTNINNATALHATFYF